MTSRSLPRPCSALEARERLLSLVGQGTYVYGTGDYRPKVIGGKLVDKPWTTHESGLVGSDCAGVAICWAYMLRRHRPGFARGRAVGFDDVDDDINCNSAIEDALTARELFEVVTTPAIGVILAYPSFSIKDADGEVHQFIGHCAGVVSIDRCLEWNPLEPDYSLLDIVQCRGGTGRKPGVIRSDASLFDHHDAKWSQPARRTVMLRAIV